MLKYFENPGFLVFSLFLIPSTIFIIKYLSKLKKDDFLLLVNENQISFNKIKKNILLRTLFFSLFWLCLVFALASPFWGVKLEPQRQEGSSVVFAVDISRSMTVSDVAPSRLFYTSDFISFLLSRLEETQVGLVLVKGRSFLSIPMTSDYRAVNSMLQVLSPSLVSSPGSGLEEGLKTAINAFHKNSSSTKTIIFFTDGDETSGSLADIAKEIKKENIRLIIVGVGTEAGEEISIYPNSTEGGFYLTKLNEELLIETVKLSSENSFYINGLDAGSALDVLNELKKDKTSYKIFYSSKKNYRYSEFIGLGFVFLVLGFVFGGSSWKKD